MTGAYIWGNHLVPQLLLKTMLHTQWNMCMKKVDSKEYILTKF